MDAIYIANFPHALLSERQHIVDLVSNCKEFDSEIERVFGSKAQFTHKILEEHTGLMGEFGNVGDPKYVEYNAKVRAAKQFWARFQ